MNKTKVFKVVIEGPEVDKVDVIGYLNSMDQNTDFNLIGYKETLYLEEAVSQK